MKKVDDKEAVAKYGITPVDTKWIDTDKAFEGGAHADQIANVCVKSSKVTVGHTCMQGLHQWKR